jgi:DNA repair exonuclease SbcCD ATPase subunit
MWILKQIEFENLFSHKKSSYKFKNGICTVIVGENKSDVGADNNGAGKTTLLEGICLGLTNESLRGLDKETFINDNTNDCFISIYLENPILKKTLLVERTFYRGTKPVKIKVIEDGVEDLQLTKSKEATEKVLDLIGITKDDLIRYFIISQDNTYRFFTASDGDKKEILNRITNADIINPLLDELKDRATKNNTNVQTVENELSRLDGQKQTLLLQRKELLEPDEENDGIEELKTQLENKKKLFNTANDNLTTQGKERDRINNELEKLGDLTEENDKLVKKGKLLRKEKNESQELVDDLENSINGVITCPKCKNKFLPAGANDKLSPQELEDCKKQADKLLKQTTKTLDEHIAVYRLFEKKLEKQEGLQTELRKIKRTISDTTIDRNGYEKAVEKLKNQIEELSKNDANTAAVQKLDDSLAEIERKEKAQLTLQKSYLEQKTAIGFWQYNMGRSGFSTYLANKSVKAIEGTTNLFLRKFHTDLQVVINGFTVLKSGTIREKIDVFITSDGLFSRPYMGKSGGERGKVYIAGVLALQSLINKSAGFGKGLDLLCFDESFPGIDSKGQEGIIRILEKLGQTIFVITQNLSNEFNSISTLKVVKSNDVSVYQ